MVTRHATRLGIPADRRRSAVRSVFAGYGRYWAEAFWVRPRRRRQIEETTVVTGLDRIRNAQAEGRGMIFALPHLGNWEFAGPIADQLRMELVAVAENLDNRYIRDWFVRLRRSMGIGIVLATGQTQVMRELEAVLGRNGGVALVCDRDIKGRGVEVEFFGERTTLPAGPVALALRTGAALFPVGAYFDQGAGHHVVIRPALDLSRSADRTEDLRLGTQQLARELEELIRQAPEQWHLLQPNWPSDRLAV
jgi:KDO2-lipid IV(A) lauroyltransferase